ncbi:NTP transferase domain-containing protein, partial [Bacillus sp. JJ1474]
MKAFILAAGEGKRLRPYTENLPKCKVSLAGIPLIERQIETLVKSGINDITLLTGYHSQELNYLKMSTLHNPYYHCTNMVFTLMYAMEDIADLDSVIISYGDIIYDTDII